MSWLHFISQPPSTPNGVDKTRATPKAGVHFDTDWAYRSPAKLVRRLGVWGFFKPAVRLYASPRVVGVDRLRNIKAPVIFAANHHSHADTSVLLATLPSKLRDDLSIAAGADYFFPNRVTGAFSALFIGAIPIERRRLSKLSIRNGLRALEKGRSLLIFPEGGRSPDGYSREHRPGAAYLAKRGKVAVVPVYLDGTGSILPKGRNWPTRGRSAVVFGDAMKIDDGEDPRVFAKRIEQRIGELADEFGSGWWQARKNAYAADTPDPTGPDAGAWRRRWALGPKPSEQRVSPTKPKWPNL